MKLQTTLKQIKKNYSKIIAIGYCDAQYLLSSQSPFAYYANMYGWRCDFYDINGVCISIGYSTIGDKIDSDVVKIYDDKAKKDLKNSNNYLNELLKYKG